MSFMMNQLSTIWINNSSWPICIQFVISFERLEIVRYLGGKQLLLLYIFVANL